MSDLRTTLIDNRKIAIPAALVFLVAAAVLLFGVLGVHTLFIDDEVDEAAPAFASGAGASGLDSDEVGAGLAADMSDAAVEVEMPSVVEVADPMPAEMAAEPEVVTLAAGSFVDRSHPASGTALVLNDGSEQRFLRFEDFSTDNGPDLNVYLTNADADADAGAFGADGDFVDLGDLKGNIGSQNYEIPADVDLDEFDTVVIWCVRFGVAFGAADLIA